MTRQQLAKVWSKSKNQRIGAWSPTPTEQAAGLVFGQRLSIAAAIQVCDEMRGPFWFAVAVVLEEVADR